MAELFDEYDHYNFDHDKHIFSGHSGKQRTKKEVIEHTNHPDPAGHSRKIVTNLINNKNNNKKVEGPVSSSTKSDKKDTQ